MSDRRYLGLRLAGRDLAVDAAEVAAVLPGHDFAAIAHPHPWICGVARHENADFLVVDLAALRGWGRGRARAIVVLERGPERTGFFADRVSGLLSASRHQPKPGVIQTSGRSRILVTADEVLHTVAYGATASVFRPHPR